MPRFWMILFCSFLLLGEMIGKTEGGILEGKQVPGLAAWCLVNKAVGVELRPGQLLEMLPFF
jgi:hypothetical protein